MSVTKDIAISFYKRNGAILAAIRIIFYPISLLFTTPFKLLLFFNNSFVLLKGDWGNYSGFNPERAFVNFFYWTRAFNIYKYGKTGYSPHFGLQGDYPMSRGFHYSLFSLYSYWIAPNITVIVGMFGWLLMHLLWINEIDPYYLLIVMFLLLISTQFYSNIVLQNYNVLGWLFVPLILYGIMSGNWIMVGIATLFAAAFSYTVGAICITLLGAFALYSFSFFPIIAFLPALLLMIIQLRPVLKVTGSENIISSLLRAMGFTKTQSKYKRSKRKDWPIIFYLLIIFAQYILLNVYLTQELNFFLLIGIGIFILNFFVARFADHQSIYMLILSLFTVNQLMLSEYPISLISFWIVISPMPFLISVYDKKNIDVVASMKPFNIKPLMESMKLFFKDVEEDEGVFMAFNDPDGDYNKIFDGYRRLIELPHYYSVVKGFRFMPDWWSTMRNNRIEDEDFWGVEQTKVVEYISKLKPDYIIIYQESSLDLNPDWEKQGFSVCSSLDWKIEFEALQIKNIYKAADIKWWLLKVPVID